LSRWRAVFYSSDEWLFSNPNLFDLKPKNDASKHIVGGNQDALTTANLLTDYLAFATIDVGLILD
jgi:hypothetical protein